MMGWESQAVDTLFASELAKDATYTPQGGSGVAVRVMVKRPDQIVDFGETEAVAETAIFEVRVADVATPQEGDTLTYDGTPYEVKGDPVRRDPDRLVWTLDTEPP